MKSTGRMIVTVMLGWLVLQPVSATEWQVPSWRKWLIEQEVKNDTVVKPSVMFPASEKPKRVDTHPLPVAPIGLTIRLHCSPNLLEDTISTRLSAKR